jgi:prepilin peptidase CpaA
MPLAENLRLAIAVAVSGVLVWAAAVDVMTRRIPNAAVLALIGLFLGWTAIDMGAGAVSSLEAAGLALAITVALYAFKIIGAGDSKLFSAAALFAGIGYLPYFAFATALAGGAIALVSVASRPQRALVMFTLRGKGDFGSGIPYGAAIAVGGIAIIWGALSGWLTPIAYGAPTPVTVQSISQALSGH